MKDHRWLLIFIGVAAAVAPFMLIGIGIASDYRAGHPRRPYEPHNARNIVLGFAVAIVATVMFAGLSHHSQAPTLAPVRADSANRGTFCPVAGVHGDGSSALGASSRVCRNRAEVDSHHVHGASIWPHSVREYARQWHDGHHRYDRSVWHLGGGHRQATDYDSDDEEHSCHDNSDPRCHDDEYNAAAVNDNDRACNDDDHDGAGDHDDSHDGAGDHDDSHDGAGDHDDSHDGAGDHDNGSDVTNDTCARSGNARSPGSNSLY